ncbi:hypothetical protein FXO37_06073 [Capsicum annuum]|nr:hypothetical protein FXO37_06073 [Capsicum annuum]
MCNGDRTDAWYCCCSAAKAVAPVDTTMAKKENRETTGGVFAAISDVDRSDWAGGGEKREGGRQWRGGVALVRFCRWPEKCFGYGVAQENGVR